MTLELNTVHQGDCFTLLAAIPASSVDAIISDLPYNSTSCFWDKQLIDLKIMWEHVKRILRPGGAFVTTAAQPFTTTLINSNREWFRYELIYRKHRSTGYFDANRRPMRNHENILVFCDRRDTVPYNPQKTPGKPYITKQHSVGEVYEGYKKKPYNRLTTVNTGDRFPLSVLDFDTTNQERGKHPTQKPVELYKWLVRTYTNPGQLVLDPFAGSGTTGVACQETGRNFILIEQEPKYVEAARLRLETGPRFEVLPGGKDGRLDDQAMAA
jgi:site-specific DNA-methyltransferase (adenine-specific)